MWDQQEDKGSPVCCRSPTVHTVGILCHHVPAQPAASETAVGPARRSGGGRCGQLRGYTDTEGAGVLCCVVSAALLGALAFHRAFCAPAPPPCSGQGMIALALSSLRPSRPTLSSASSNERTNRKPIRFLATLMTEAVTRGKHKKNERRQKVFKPFFYPLQRNVTQQTTTCRLFHIQHGPTSPRVNKLKTTFKIVFH